MLLLLLPPPLFLFGNVVDVAAVKIGIYINVNDV
jgi:hypothetical protein